MIGRHNLLEHFGTVSSLRSQAMPQFAGCYDLMDAGVLFEVRAVTLPASLLPYLPARRHVRR